jgi:hypothetical protein
VTSSDLSRVLFLQFPPVTFPRERCRAAFAAAVPSALPALPPPGLCRAALGLSAHAGQPDPPRAPGARSYTLEQFRNCCGLKKIARCGFPWEKTTKRPVAARISCSGALVERSDVRLSLGKAACSAVASQSSTGNPGSVYTHCETAPSKNLLSSTMAGGYTEKPLISGTRCFGPSEEEFGTKGKQRTGHLTFETTCRTVLV